MNKKDNTRKAGDIFNQCPYCAVVWKNRDTFLSDPQLKLIGYQINLGQRVAGLFLFNHACQTTIAVEMLQFRAFCHGPIFNPSSHPARDSPEYCLRKNELEPCPEKCECAYVYDVLKIIRNWPKLTKMKRHIKVDKHGKRS